MIQTRTPAGDWESQSSNRMVSQIRHTHIMGGIIPPRKQIKISTSNNIEFPAGWSTVQSVATAAGCWHQTDSCKNLGPVTYLNVVWDPAPTAHQEKGNCLSLYLAITARTFWATRFKLFTHASRNAGC